MYTRRNYTQRAEEENVNEAVPPQAVENPQVPIENEAMSTFYIRGTIKSLTQVLDCKVSWDTRVQVNTNDSTMNLRG